MSNPALMFALRGEGTDTLEIDIYDAIGESWWGEGVSAKSVRRALKGAQDAKTIKLRVNSRGGDVVDGFAIYNLLRDHPARVEADVDGLAASMASVILMAADEIRIAAGAMIMVHNPWGISIGEADELRAHADLLDKMRDQIADAYVARTKLDRERVLAMMDEETWLTAEEAVALGFADVVKEHAKPKALASLSLCGLDRAPACFAAAIERARAEIAEDELSDADESVDELAEERASDAETAQEATGEETVETRAEPAVEAPEEQPAAASQLQSDVVLAAIAERDTLRAQLATVSKERDEALRERDKLRTEVERYKTRDWLDTEIAARGLAVKPDKREKWVDMAIAKGRDVVIEILDGQNRPPTGPNPLDEIDMRAERDRPRDMKAAIDSCMPEARAVIEAKVNDGKPPAQHHIRAVAIKLARERFPEFFEDEPTKRR